MITKGSEGANPIIETQLSVVGFYRAKGQRGSLVFHFIYVVTA